MPNENFDKYFKEGCWIRVLTDPNEERTILLTREGLSSVDLLGHDNQTHPQYTSYSSCTFIRHEIPVQTFNFDISLEDNKSNITNHRFAVIIRSPTSRKIDWWYHGGCQAVSDSDLDIIVRKRLELTKVSLDDYKKQHWGYRGEQIAQELEKDYRESSNDDPLPWNEGKFRYQKNHIIGFAINPNSKKSVAHAFAFRNVLGIDPRQAGFYFYDYAEGRCTSYSSAALLARHRLEGNNVPITISEITEMFRTNGSFDPLSLKDDQQYSIRTIDAFSRCEFPAPEVTTIKNGNDYKYNLVWDRENLTEDHLARLKALLKSNVIFRIECINNIADLKNPKVIINKLSSRQLAAMYDHLIYEERPIDSALPVLAKSIATMRSKHADEQTNRTASTSTVVRSTTTAAANSNIPTSQSSAKSRNNPSFFPADKSSAPAETALAKEKRKNPDDDDVQQTSKRNKPANSAPTGPGRR
jgi:hypothetical protein